jgi:hypothetical protein
MDHSPINQNFEFNKSRQGYIIFATKLWNITNFVGEWSIKLVYSTLETRRGQDARGDMGGDNRTSKIPTSSETSGDLDLA